MTKPTRLIVIMAFDLADDGELMPAFDAMQFDSEDRAIRTARDLSNKHPPGILFQSGEVPDME